MKITLLSFIALIVAGHAHAQLTPDDLPGKAPGHVLKAPIMLRSQVVTTIWSEDFADGIPEDWGTFDVEGLAHWEYRGPDSDPDLNTGAIGSCAFDGVDGSPIQSDTGDNGFVIFDSNYWDDPIGPCGNFETGEDPGPHFAALTTPSFDLSSYEYVALRWEHFYTQWINNSNVYVEVSVDDGEWMQIWEVVIPLGISTANAEQVVLDLSEVAAGSSDVKLRWVFDGEYYWWMVDDIEVFEIPLYDMRLDELTYSNFDPFNSSNGDFTGLEYSIYPDEAQGPIRPQALVSNDGAIEQTNVPVDFRIEHLEVGEDIYTYPTTIDSIPSQTIRAGNGLTTNSPDVIGHYKLHVTSGEDEADPSPANNLGVRKFKVENAEYARDTLARDGVYIPTGDYYDLPWEQGNVFLITGQDQDAESITVGLAEGSNNPGTEVTGKIYKFSLAGGVTADLIAETESVPATEDHFNDYGEGNMLLLPFSSPVTLQKDSAYVVVAGNTGGAQNLWYAHSGDSPDYSSWVKFNANEWFFLGTTPMVRVNFGSVDQVSELMSSPGRVGSAFPNPTNASITFPIELRQFGKGEVIWNDMHGRVVLREALFSSSTGPQEFQVDIPSQAGVYSASVRWEGVLLSSQSVVVQ